MSRIRPNFKQPGQDLEIKVSEKVRSEIEKAKAEIEAKADERVRAILAEREEKSRKDKADKIAEAVDTARKIAGDKEKIEKGDKGAGIGAGVVSTVEQAGDVGNHSHVHGEGAIDCPTCKGHVHKAEDKSGLVYKCTKDGCGFEAILVDKRSDFKCNTCGMPILKPKKPEDIENCPFCKGSKAIRHDWGKLWGVTDKK